MLSEKKAILGIKINPKQYVSLGTPYDVSIYIGKKNEFKTPKPKTIFCDIDGTIINHAHKFSDLVENQQTSLIGVIEKFNEWDSIGHKIILCTARKESAREMTEKHLKDLGFCWDQLIMGLTSGTRILINDKLSKEDENRSISINVITDEGFLDVNWDTCGL